MSKREIAIEEYKRIRVLHGQLAKRRLTHFATFCNKEIEIEWFHKEVYDKLDLWIEGKIKKLAIFMPPQHGKSEMSSITTPAKILGKKPKSKIVVASYSDTLAKKFNRRCQDIMDSPEYKHIYPKTVLPAKGIEITNELRNNGYFEVVKHKGFYKSVSIGGSLTGDPIDYGIIDDPIKDRKQANSKTYRQTVWDWYQDVFKTRLHNDSSQLMLFTRWHEDDLAGRLFNPKNEHYDESEASEWTILCFQALKEEKKPIPISFDYQDPRKIGEALWENKHSKKKHEETKRVNPTGFASLQQQRPSPAGGGKIKKEWFNIIQPSELPFNPHTIKKDFFLDGAFTKDVQNDESATLTACKYKGDAYIFGVDAVRKELHEYLKYIVPYLKQMGYKPTSKVNIEMKASGYGFYSMLRSPEYGKFNCVKVPGKTVAEGKLTRVETSQPTLASGKVYLVNTGGWIESFIDQCTSFPNDVHDDKVDVLTFMIYDYFINETEVSVSYS